MELSSYEAEKNFVVLQLSITSIIQGVTSIAHIFLKVIKGKGPLEGVVEVVSSKYLPRT